MTKNNRQRRTAVCSWSLQPTDPHNLANAVQHCSLSTIQLALDPLITEQWSLDELKQALEESHLTLCSGMITTLGEDYSTLESIKQTGGLRPDQHWEHNLNHARQAAPIARELGINLITLHAGFIPEHTTTEYTTMTDRIKAIADVFESEEITLALETGQERASDLLDMLELPGMSTIGVNFDPANMILYNMGNPAQALELLADRIVQVHMKDATPTQTPGTWGTEVPAGEGAVDWDHFFKTLNAFTKPIDVVIEREAGASRINDIIQAAKLASKYGYTHDG
ncbi:MAG: sugar phosphate isomerase/epimerase [Phycisphaerales bacterium]|nr:sugar phosphate isomerase/epimerase [Phycisphaerales bacterium]